MCGGRGPAAGELGCRRGRVRAAGAGGPGVRRARGQLPWRSGRERRRGRRRRRGPGRSGHRPRLRRGVAELEPRHLARRHGRRPGPGGDLGAPDAVPAGDAGRGRGRAGGGPGRRRPRDGGACALLRHDRPGRGADHPDDGWSPTGCWCAARGPVDVTQHPDGESALVAYGDALAATVPRAAPATHRVVLLVPVLRGGHGRRRPRGRARPGRERPRRRRGAGGRRVEPRARRGAAARGAVRIAGARGGRGAGLGPAGRHLAGTVRRRGEHHPGPRAPRLAGRTGRQELGTAPRRPRPDPPGCPGAAGRRTARLVDLGVDYLKLDFLYAGAVPGPAPGGRRRGSRLPGGTRAGARRGGARRLPGGLRRADPAQPRARRRHARLPRHLPRGRRGRLDRVARADAAGRPGVAAGPAVGERPRLRRGATVLLAAGAVGAGRPSPGRAALVLGPAGRPRPWGLATVRDLVAAGGRTVPFEADVLAESAALAQAEGAR